MKDIILAYIFNSLGNGMYTLFNYASKFISVIFQIVNAPILNVFISKASNEIANKNNYLVKIYIKNVLIQTIVMFLVSSIIIYFSLPYILTILFIDKFSKEQVLIIQNIFCLMIIFYFIVTIESPFARLISLLKLFNYGLTINFIFFINV